ncbi:MAG: pyruvate carboxylase subunit B [Dehalococcoidia bacterium]|nr:MAG: pyruvate carboxylase subunit B [Dehalococcoidia bacterium]
MVGIGEGPILAKDLTTEETKTRPKANNPVKICDTTFRDGHQSSLATRMWTEDMEPIAPEMNKCGFYSMEVWGGATFDVPHRFLGEDPWERPRLLKKLMPDTPLQMLLRGQNLVAYRNHPDDLVRAFVHHAAEVGIDIFRVFDAVNDERNHEMAYKAIKETGKHIQGAVCYSLTQPRMGGSVYNLDYYVNKSLILQDMGADSICIKDQAGLISPYDAYELIKALKEVLKVPVELHTHYTSGQASMSLLKAIEAGVDIIDTALAPFALRSSQPAIEPIVVALYGTDRDTGLDIEQLCKCGEMVEQIAPKYRDFVDTSKMAVIDAGVLIHQIPGGMTTNLVSQLKQADALDRLGDCQKMTAKTRAELGYPPLVTPTSQIVGAQAVQNVLVGPYEIISKEVKDYCWGLYGKPPAPIDPEIQKMVLKGYERGEEPITCRAADMVEPELEKAKEEAKDIAKDIGDTLLYALYPTTGMRFLRWKYGLDTTIPDDWKPPRAPKTLEDVKKEDELIAKALAGKLVERVEKEVPAKGPGVRTFNVYVEDEYYKVEVEPTGAAAITGPVAGPAPRVAQPAPRPEAATASEPAPVVVAEGEVTVLVPMPGTVVRYVVNVGDHVKAGDIVVMLEAMKMENAIPTPADGVIKALNFGPGASVKKGDVLAVIAK